MTFKERNIREIAEYVIGNEGHFPYRSSSKITEFFDECGLDFIHGGSTRWSWTAERLQELLSEPSQPHKLPDRFVHLLRILMQKDDAPENDPQRTQGITELNKPLRREGYEAFYGDDEILYIKHIGTKIQSNPSSPQRAFTQDELHKIQLLKTYIEKCSEDEFTENVIIPLLRQRGFQHISFAGHKDKALEYGKDIWMKYELPTKHILYFGIQVKKGKLDSAATSRSTNANMAEIHNQVLMMIGHEIFDPETNKKCLVDHAFIIAGGEITKSAKNWLGGKLDASKRSQILFMEKEDIINLYIESGAPLPADASPIVSKIFDDDVPF